MWRVALATRVGIGIYAIVLYAFAVLICATPYAHGTGAVGFDWLDETAALAMACLAIVASFAFFAVMRIRVTLDATKLAAIVVDRHDWLLVPHFRVVALPVREIASVERRTEIDRILGLRSMRDALSIVTTRGERIGLFSNTVGEPETLPLGEVAEAIAALVPTAVRDDGTVFAHGSGLYGAASSSWSERPLDRTHASRVRHGVMLAVHITTGLLFLSVLLRALL